MILAEVPTVPPGLDEMLERIAYLGGILLLALKIIEHFKAKPPLGEQMNILKKWVEENFPTKESTKGAFESVKQRIDEKESIANQSRVELKADVTNLSNKLSERSTSIFDAIRALGREISNLEGRLRKTGRLPNVGGHS